MSTRYVGIHLVLGVSANLLTMLLLQLFTALVVAYACVLFIYFFLPFKFYGFMFAARTFTVFIVSWCVNLICACAAHAPTNNSLTRY